MSAEVSKQLTDNPRVLYVAAGIIGTMGVVPGMPNLVFLSIATLLGVAGYLRSQQSAVPDVIEATSEVEAKPTSNELSWDDVSSLDQIGLEVGYRLIPLVDAKRRRPPESHQRRQEKLSQELDSSWTPCTSGTILTSVQANTKSAFTV